MGQTLQIPVLDPTPLPQHIELLRIVHCTAGLQPLADRPFVLDMRPLVGRRDVREQYMVLFLRHGGPCGR